MSRLAPRIDKTSCTSISRWRDWGLLEIPGEAWGIAADHIDDLIDQESDLEPLAEALLDGFIEAAKADTDYSPPGNFFEECEMGIRALLLDRGCHA